ncbi:MAG: hypothetical protein K6E47_16940 [Lachnospiraceae bacterium]|nr:hypothetical protein [Lachnospiraceae bacterium]
MKKFFKALALVLALTLVIGSIPVSAAIDFAFTKDKKVIYIGEAQGTRTDEEGNVIKCKTKESYTLSKFITNFDSDTMRSKLVSSNENVVAIDGHKVVAKGIGTAKVDVTILDKDTKTDIGGTTLSIKIVVKKNATSVPVKVKDAEGNEIEDVANYKFAANTDYIFTLTRKDDEGNRIDTDKRKLECDSDKVSIKAGEAGIMYRVNFAEAGEYTLKATAFQSTVFPNPTVDPVEIKVKVGYEAVAVDQYSLNQAVVTFETNVANPSKDLFKLYTKVVNNGEEKLLDDSQVKGVEVLADDKTKVVATFEADFVGGREYFLYYGEKEVGSFVAASVNADSVARVEIIAGQEFEVNKTGQLKYKLFNDKDVDITSAYGKSLNGTISAELVDKTDTTSNIWGLDVVLGKENTNYDVKLTYSWYDSTGIPQSKEATGVIRCIPQKVFERTDFKGVIGSSKTILGGDGKLNGECTDSLFAYGDADTQLQVAIGYTLNGNVTYDVIDGAGIHNNTNVYDSYKVTSASERIIMVVGGYKLSATGEGTTNIVIYGVKAGQADQVVGVVSVTVNPKRTLADFKVSASKLALNMANAEDAITFDLVALDQYGVEMAKNVTVKQIYADAYTGPVADGAVQGTVAAVPGNKAEITLKAANLTPNGPDDKTTLIFEFDCEGKKYRISNLDCGYATTADRQLLDIKGESELKTGLTSGSTAKTTTIALKGLANNKYAVSGAAVSFFAGAPAIDRVDTSARFVYTVKKDGVLLNGQNANFVGNTFTSVVKGTGAASGTAIKLAAGTYAVDLYEFKTSSDGTFATPYMIDSASFKVTDDQAGLTFEKVKIEGIGHNLTSAADLAGCFKFKFDNNDVTAAVVIDATFAGDGSSAYVKSAKYVGTNAELGTFEVTVAIDLVVRK